MDPPARPSRRTLLGAAVGGGVMGPTPWHPVQLDGPLDALETVDLAVWQMAGEYDTTPCEATQRVARILAATANKGAAGTRGDARRSWHRAHARALVVQAQAQHHRGYRADAEATLRGAMTAARTSEYGEVQALVWALTARIAERAGQPQHAVNAALCGRRLAPRTPIALQLTAKTLTGAWAALGRPDMVRRAVADAMELQAAIGPAGAAPRGYSLLDQGLHPADVALSAAAALTLVGVRDEKLIEQIDVDGAEGAHVSGACIALARDAVNEGHHDRAADLLVRTAAALPDWRDWAAIGVLDVGGRIETSHPGLAEAMAGAAGWLGGRAT